VEACLFDGPLLHALIHPSVWNAYSRKLNFRFTEFSEVRYPQATPKQHQKYAIWVIRQPLQPVTLVPMAGRYWRVLKT
jgi:hypothetical protein